MFKRDFRPSFTNFPLPLGRGTKGDRDLKSLSVSLYKRETGFAINIGSSDFHLRGRSGSQCERDGRRNDGQDT